VELCILPQIAQRNAAGCIISQRKTVWVIIVFFVVCLRLSAGSARDLLGFLCADRLSTLACILPQIAQIPQRNAASCIISQRKTVWDGGVLGFVCVNQRKNTSALADTAATCKTT